MSQRQSGRLARWQLDLQQYDFKIAYVKGVNNPVADCLSRDIEDQVQLMAITRLQAGRIKAKRSYKETEELEKLSEGNKEKTKETDLSSLYLSVKWQEEQQKDKFKKLYTVKDGIVFRNKADNGKYRIVVPEHLVQEFIERVHSSKLCAHGGI